MVQVAAGLASFIHHLQTQAPLATGPTMRLIPGATWSENDRAAYLKGIEALKRSGKEPTRDKLIAELDRTKDFDTHVLAGQISWSPNDRDGVKEVAVAGFVKGKPTVLKAWGKPL